MPKKTQDALRAAASLAFAQMQQRECRRDAAIERVIAKYRIYSEHRLALRLAHRAKNLTGANVGDFPAWMEDVIVNSEIDVNTAVSALAHESNDLDAARAAFGSALNKIDAKRRRR